MWRAAKHALFAAGFMLFAGCSGGSCASGCSCAGITPLPEGFTSGKRVENAASLRLTDSGVTYLNDNLDGIVSSVLGGGSGVVEFPIGPIMGSQLGINYFVCEDGPKPMSFPPECIIELDVAASGLLMTVEPDHNIKIAGPLPVRLQALPMRIEYFCVGTFCVESNIIGTLTGNDTCPTETQAFTDIDVDVDVSIAIDTDMSHSRYGYSRVAVDVTLDEQKLSDSIKLCGSFDAGILDDLLSVIGDVLISQVTGLIDGQLEEALCQQANPELNPPCPDGSNDVDGVCRYGADADAECVSIIVGMDGNVDMAALLGARGSFDLLFAAGGHSQRDDGSGFSWGDLDPVAGGATVSAYGGVEPKPLSGCVPRVESVLPTDIPVPDELRANTIDGWPASTPGPHFGLALSERFFNHALNEIHQSGGLCLGIGNETVAQLTTSLLQIGLGTPSMVELGRQKEGQPAAIALRPQEPPHVEFGNGTSIETDPLIHVTMNQTAIDIYAWSVDRYVRTLTATFDIDVPVNLEVTPDGLVPVIENLSLSNGSVTNAELLREDPAKIADALESLVGGLVGDLLGSALPVIDINEQLAGANLNAELVIPETVDGQGSAGLRKLTKGSDDFLGLFAGLKTNTTSAKAETDVSLAGVNVDPAGLSLDTWKQALGPRARLTFADDPAAPHAQREHQYRVDGGAWHPFKQVAELVVDDPRLRAEGRHTIEIRSRFVGEPMSLDATPALIELVIDEHAPRLAVDADPNSSALLVTIGDTVTPIEDVHLRYRLRHDEHWTTWGAWTSAVDLPTIDPRQANAIEVEARDGNENVASIAQALIRGRATGGGCECSIQTPSSRHGQRPALLALLIGAALLLRRRRRRA